MLKNAPFLITIGVDTAENEPRKESWVVARTGVSILSPDCGERRLRGLADEGTRCWENELKGCLEFELV